MGRDVHAGVPHLAAVDPPAVDAVAGLAHRTGFHVGRVAAMVGFGQAEGGAAAPLEPAEDEFLLLLLARRELFEHRDEGEVADDAMLVLKIIVERSEEHTSELQSLMRISYAVFCLKKKKHTTNYT